MIILLSILFISSALFGDVAYINVTNVKTKKQLSYPHKKLKYMGLKMSFKKKSYGYAAYLGPYKSNKRLYSEYNKVKDYFPNARIVVYKTDNAKPKAKKKLDEKSNTTQEKNIKLKQHLGYIAGAGIGYASSPSNHSIISGTVDVTEPNSSGMSYNIYVGYDFKKDLTLLFNYMYINTNDLAFHNYYGSLNYRFKNIGMLEPYFGVSLGYSALLWNTSPIASASPSSNNNSDDMLYGTQVGFNYKLNREIFLKVDYSCLFLNHATNIAQDTTNTSKLEHDTLHSLMIGLGYSF